MIQLKRGTTENWESLNLVLADGQIGIERKADGNSALKVGDGNTPWSSLPYIWSGNGEISGEVYKLLDAEPIEENSDLDTFTKVGNYACLIPDETITNSPFAEQEYRLIIQSATNSTNSVLQIAYGGDGTEKIRVYSGEEWSEWKEYINSAGGQTVQDLVIGDVDMTLTKEQYDELMNISTEASSSNLPQGGSKNDVLSVDEEGLPVWTSSITVNSVTANSVMTNNIEMSLTEEQYTELMELLK